MSYVQVTLDGTDRIKADPWTFQLAHARSLCFPGNGTVEARETLGMGHEPFHGHLFIKKYRPPFWIERDETVITIPASPAFQFGCMCPEGHQRLEAAAHVWLGEVIQRYGSPPMQCFREFEFDCTSNRITGLDELTIIVRDEVTWNHSRIDEIPIFTFPLIALGLPVEV